jgi:hypothetical protein
MRTRTLLSTAAAVLLIGAGTAYAQSAKDQAAPERAPSAQRNAPAEKMAPSMNAGERKTPAETTGQGSSESKSGAAMDKSGSSMDKSGTAGAGAESPQGKGKAEMNGKTGKSGTTGAASDQDQMKSGAKSGEGTKAQSSDKNEMKGSTAGDMKKNESTRGSARDKTQDTTKGAASERNTGGKAGESSTTGQGAAGAAAKLSSEQRTKITTIIKEQKVQPTHLNISVRVGARVPESVHFYPVPTQVIEVYPEWRGYYYILVSGEILIIEPDTHEIVAILAV